MEESFLMTTSTTRNKSNLLNNKFLKFVIPLIFILSVWELAATIANDSFFLPSVPDVLQALLRAIAEKSFFKTVLTSLYRVIAGLLIGTALGIGAATLSHYSRLFNTVFSPIISVMKATPVACIIVLLWINLNYTNLTIFVSVLMVLPIIWQNVLSGYQAIDPKLREVADVLELSMVTRIRVLILPSVLNYLAPAFVTSIGMAWKSEIAAEIMTSNNIGRLIYDFKTVSYDTASMFAWTVIIIALSMIFEGSAKYLFRRLMPDAEIK